MNEDTAERGSTLKARNRVTGVLLAVFGGFVILEATGYAFGTPARMGPGFLPVILGGLIIAVGVLIAVIDEDGAAAAVPAAWTPAAFVLAALLAFALLIDRAGLVAATFALVVISGRGDGQLNWRETAVLSLVLTGLVYLVFVRLLGVPFDLVRGFG